MTVSTAPASASGLYANPREDWLAQHTEEIIDPARPIVDPHHHLWDRGGLRYMIEEMVVRHRLRPQHHRDRLCRLPLDVPRQRAGSVPPGRRSRIRQWRRRDVRERRLRQGGDLRRHRQPRQSAARRRRQGRCWKPRSSPATAASAASGIPRHGMPTPMSPACMRRGRRACCSTQHSARALPASRRSTSVSKAGCFIRRSANSPISPAPFPTPKSCSTIAAARSASAAMPAGARRSFRSGRPRSRKSPNARTSWSSSAGLRCACSAMTFICGRSRPPRRKPPRRGGPISRPASRPSGPIAACSKAIFRPTRASAAIR